MSKKKDESLETSLAEIGKLIDEMEHKDLSLEQSLQHFERGIQLIKHAQKVLQTAEQKVQILMEKSGQQLLDNYEHKDHDAE